MTSRSSALSTSPAPTPLPTSSCSIFPCTNRILAAGWANAALSGHRARLAAAKSMVDTAAPAAAHIKINRKKKRCQLEQRNQKIDKENRMLLKRMSDIMRAPNPDFAPPAYSPVFANSHVHVKSCEQKELIRANSLPVLSPYRRQQAAKIVEENMHLVKRLRQGHGHLDRKHWAQHADRHDALLNQLREKAPVPIPQPAYLKHTTGRLNYGMYGIEQGEDEQDHNTDKYRLQLDVNDEQRVRRRHTGDSIMTPASIKSNSDDGTRDNQEDSHIIWSHSLSPRSLAASSHYSVQIAQLFLELGGHPCNVTVEEVTAAMLPDRDDGAYSDRDKNHPQLLHFFLFRAFATSSATTGSVSVPYNLLTRLPEIKNSNHILDKDNREELANIMARRLIFRNNQLGFVTDRAVDTRFTPAPPPDTGAITNSASDEPTSDEPAGPASPGMHVDVSERTHDSNPSTRSPAFRPMSPDLSRSGTNSIITDRHSSVSSIAGSSRHRQKSPKRHASKRRSLPRVNSANSPSQFQPEPNGHSRSQSRSRSPAPRSPSRPLSSSSPSRPPYIPTPSLASLVRSAQLSVEEVNELKKHLKHIDEAPPATGSSKKAPRSAPRSTGTTASSRARDKQKESERAKKSDTKPQSSLPSSSDSDRTHPPVSKNQFSQQINSAKPNTHD